MSEPVKLSVRSELQKIIKELQAISETNQEVGDSFKTSSDEIDKAVKKNTNRIRQQVNDTAAISRRMAEFIKDSFKNLFAVEALRRGLDMQKQLTKSVEEAIRLNNTVMKLGTTFNISSGGAANMVNKLSKAGFSAKVATDAMEGLRGTGVQGSGVVGEYAQSAGQLARISGNEESAGSISGLLARTLQAQGINQNSPTAVKALADTVYKATRTTGVGSEGVLTGMEQLLRAMPEEMRKKIGTDALAKMATASSIAGPGTTAALEKALSMDKYQRAAFDATGFSKIFGSNGIDIKALQAFAKNAKSLGGGDIRAGVKFASGGGLGDQEAEGIVRLVEAAQRIDQAQQEMAGIKESIGDFEKATRTVGEAFQAVAARAFGATGIQQGLGFGQGYVKKRLNDYAESPLASMLAVGAGGLLAGGLLGAGGKRLGGVLGLGGGVATGLALKEAGVTPVYVTNAKEIGSQDSILDKLIGPGAGAMGSTWLGKLGKVGGALGTAGLVAGGAMAAYETGNLVNEMMGGNYDENRKEYEKRHPEAMGPQPLSTPTVVAPMQPTEVNIIVETKTPNLVVTKKPQRVGTH